MHIIYMHFYVVAFKKSNKKKSINTTNAIRIRDHTRKIPEIMFCFVFFATTVKVRCILYFKQTANTQKHNIPLHIVKSRLAIPEEHITIYHVYVNSHDRIIKYSTRICASEANFPVFRTDAKLNESSPLYRNPDPHNPCPILLRLRI